MICLKEQCDSRSEPLFDMTQAEFASRIGVSQSFLSAVEHGRNEASAGVLLAISREFDRSLEWLLTGEE